MIKRLRLDQELVRLGLVRSRSQGESYIKLGYVTVDGNVVMKPGFMVGPKNKLKLTVNEQYVSRAALKLESAARALNLDFKDKTVLDVGSSTGGFTDFALHHGAKKVIAVDVGTDQLHRSLRDNPKIELHEKTDIRDVRLRRTKKKSMNDKPSSVRKKHDSKSVILDSTPDIVLVDVSFISLKKVLPSVSRLMTHGSILVAMAKPQFETGKPLSRGIVKNERERREILKHFELWTKKLFKITSKADSQVTGSKGNRERFYLLKRLR